MDNTLSQSADSWTSNSSIAALLAPLLAHRGQQADGSVDYKLSQVILGREDTREAFLIERDRFLDGRLLYCCLDGFPGVSSNGPPNRSPMIQRYRRPFAGDASTLLSSRAAYKHQQQYQRTPNLPWLCRVEGCHTCLRTFPFPSITIRRALFFRVPFFYRKPRYNVCNQ